MLPSLGARPSLHLLRSKPHCCGTDPVPHAPVKLEPVNIKLFSLLHVHSHCFITTSQNLFLSSSLSNTTLTLSILFHHYTGPLVHCYHQYVIDHICYSERISTFWDFLPTISAIVWRQILHFFDFIIIDYPQLEDTLSIYSQKITYNCRISQEINGK